jgi:hypothetical protein
MPMAKMRGEQSSSELHEAQLHKAEQRLLFGKASITRGLAVTLSAIRCRGDQKLPNFPVRYDGPPYLMTKTSTPKTTALALSCRHPPLHRLFELRKQLLAPSLWEPINQALGNEFDVRVVKRSELQALADARKLEGPEEERYECTRGFHMIRSLDFFLSVSRSCACVPLFHRRAGGPPRHSAHRGIAYPLWFLQCRVLMRRGPLCPTRLVEALRIRAEEDMLRRALPQVRSHPKTIGEIRSRHTTGTTGGKNLSPSPVIFSLGLQHPRLMPPTL